MPDSSLLKMSYVVWVNWTKSYFHSKNYSKNDQIGTRIIFYTLIIIGVARGLAGLAMAGPLFHWPNTNTMEQHSLAGPVIYS